MNPRHPLNPKGVAPLGTVDPASGGVGAPYLTSPAATGSRVVITVMGQDQVGIVARVAKVLADRQVPIVDITQKLIQGLFVMVLVADLTSASCTLLELKEALDREARELGVSAAVQHEKLFQAMHRI